MRPVSTKPAAGLPGYVLISDVPPAKQGGYGSQVLAWNWAEAVGDDLKLVVTHHQHPALSPKQIAADLRTPVVYYPDLVKLRFRRRLEIFKSLGELLLGRLWVPRITARIRECGGERLFAFVSNRLWFLPIADRVARQSGLPLDYYLVDDLEESARLWGHPAEARLARWVEPRMLRRAQRIFTISPGYGDHLLAKYQVRSSWLPVAILRTEVDYHPVRPTSPDVRVLTFIGGVGPLYSECLRDCLCVVEDWNRQRPAFRLRLLLLTYTSPGMLARYLGSHPDLEVLIRPSTEEFTRRLQSSWAIFLPYSFGPAERTMVTCSFPTKLTDAFLAGRPILVYGPAYASLPRYFTENGLPICVRSREGLAQAIREIGRFDSPALIQEYQRALRTFHSPDRVRQVLGEADAPPRTRPTARATTEA